MRFFIAAAFTVAAIATASAQTAAPDFTVAGSQLAALPVGHTLKKGAVIDIPHGHEIGLLDNTAGKTVTRMCVGPYKGPVEACPGPVACGLVWRTLGWCSAGTGAAAGGVPGGVKGKGAAPGGTRGAVKDQDVAAPKKDEPAYTVAGSQLPALPVGHTLGKGTVIDIPHGQELGLLDRTSGKMVMRVCAGPYKGPVETCTGPATCGPIWRSLGWCSGSPSDVKAIVPGPPGGTRGPVTDTGTPEPQKDRGAKK